MATTYKKYFPGTATLAETQRACMTEQESGEDPSSLKAIEGIINDPTTGQPKNLNEATFETVDSMLDVLDDLLFVDVSTPQGAADAAAASNGRTNIGGPGAQFNIWVNNKRTPVQVLGKTT